MGLDEGTEVRVGRSRADNATRKEQRAPTEAKHTGGRIRPTRSCFDFLTSTNLKSRTTNFSKPEALRDSCFSKRRSHDSTSYLGAAAGLGAEGLVPACAVDVVIAVPLELEQDYVGQAVGGVPAVLVPDRL